MIGNSCHQPMIRNTSISEDCLVLNVWTTNVPKNSGSDAPLKPVMFWIYGGALSIGSIFMFPIYNGSVLATNDVIFVSTNYRLGPFGFLYGDRDDCPGNQGFYDQLLALKWVLIIALFYDSFVLIYELMPQIIGQRKHR